MSLKKPRADAKLLNLPEEQHEQLVAWLFQSGLGYAKVRSLVKREFGIATSQAALSSFWSECCAPRLLQKRSQSAVAANQIADDAAKNAGTFDTATLALLRQKAFEILADTNADPDEVRGLLALALKARDQDQKDLLIAQSQRRLELLEKQSEQAKTTLANPALTPEERQLRMKEIFGMA